VVEDEYERQAPFYRSPPTVAEALRGVVESFVLPRDRLRQRDVPFETKVA